MIRCECGGKTKVIDTLGIKSGTRRRRQCLRCKSRMWTIELPATTVTAYQNLMAAIKAVEDEESRCSAALTRSERHSLRVREA